MVDDQLRRLKDVILSIFYRPWVKRIHPNVITTIGFAIGIAGIVVLFLGYNIIAFAIWILNRIFDGLDGMVARQSGKQTDFGGYYDIIIDFIIYASIPAVLAIREASPPVYIATVVLLAAFYVNSASWMYLSSLLEKRKNSSSGDSITSIQMPRGIIEGTETIIFYSLFILLPQFLVYLMAAMAVLTFLGVPQRLIYGLKQLR